MGQQLDLQVGDFLHKLSMDMMANEWRQFDIPEGPLCPGIAL
jgi:hypothetical protein